MGKKKENNIPVWIVAIVLIVVAGFWVMNNSVDNSIDEQNSYTSPQPTSNPTYETDYNTEIKSTGKTCITQCGENNNVCDFNSLEQHSKDLDYCDNQLNTCLDGCGGLSDNERYCMDGCSINSFLCVAQQRLDYEKEDCDLLIKNCFQNCLD